MGVKAVEYETGENAMEQKWQTKTKKGRGEERELWAEIGGNTATTLGDYAGEVG